MTDSPLWTARAACIGLADVFFSEDPADQAAAVAICLTECPVLDECREDLSGLEFGVVAGLTMEDRLDEETFVKLSRALAASNRFERDPSPFSKVSVCRVCGVAAADHDLDSGCYVTRAEETLG